MIRAPGGVTYIYRYVPVKRVRNRLQADAHDMPLVYVEMISV